MNFVPLRLAACSAALVASAVPARAQCAEWDGRFFLEGVGGGGVSAAIVFDDGSGPAVFVGGNFKTAGDELTKYIVKWDGSEWILISAAVDDSDPLNASVRALAVFDDGTGLALYAAGTFDSLGGTSVGNIARWDGTSWHALSTGVGDSDESFASVDALAVFDDGSGPALYAAGEFDTAGGVPATRIAKWDGTIWSAVGGGTNNRIFDVAVYDDGSGPALYAGGLFTQAGATTAIAIAKWDGSMWSAVGSGMDASVFALGVFDDGNGAALYAGGDFTNAGGTSVVGIATWDGSAWSGVGSGLSGGAVSALTTFDDASSPALYAGGNFTTAGAQPVNRVARWNGAAWSTLGSGLNAGVVALTGGDLGSGSTLFVGGSFSIANGNTPARNIASWDGSSWSSLDTGGQGILGSVRALASFDDGSGGAVYAAGTFDYAGGAPMSKIARFDGTTWSAVGGGVTSGTSINTMIAFDDGAGPALYVGGAFASIGGTLARNIARWDGTNWSALGAGLGANSVTTPLALEVFDDGWGRALYACGTFFTAGGIPANKVAKWDGSTWSPLGIGIAGDTAFPASAMRSFDDGSGPALYVGGHFDTAGGMSVANIARWDGANWSAVGAGLRGFPLVGAHVAALAVFDDGGGPALYAAGALSVGASHSIAKWDGSTWSGLGTGSQVEISALTVFHDGVSSALYAAGRFTIATGGPGNLIAKWNGASWSSLDDGVGYAPGSELDALCVHDDGADGAPDLYGGGKTFTLASSHPADGVVEWYGCEPGAPYCFGDGLDPVVTAGCPCGNIGDPGRGCANSNAALGGARLSASGSTSPNTIVLTCIGVSNNTLCTFLRGPNSNPQAMVFGDGIKCINPPIFRFGQQNSGQMGNAPFTVAVPAPTELPGSTFHYAVHYRNPTGGFCAPELFNASNGYTIAWR